MNCGKCEAPLADDAKFCPQCGARVDGKKECWYCRREIAEDAIYCTYCGKRQDGKIVCNKCGEVYEGNFCPKCGAAARPQAANAPGHAPAAMYASAAMDASEPSAPSAIAVDERRSAARTRANRVMAIIKQSLLYGALCVLFICSFFVTFSLFW